MLDLGKSLTARVGGTAREVLRPANLGEFVEAVDRLRCAGREFYVLGGGSNVLAADGEFPAPIVLTTQLKRVRELNPRSWEVEAGVNLTALVHRSTKAGLKGLECCAGVPGTVGAAIRINAGGKFGTIAQVVREVTLLTRDGRVERRPAAPEDFGYRRSSFWGSFVLCAALEFEPGDPVESQGRVREVVTHKRVTQPLRYPSAGCVFRNPPGMSAGKLIDDCGLKGLRVGGAMVSPLHANYLVNVERATGADYFRLIDVVRGEVRRRFDVDLELEVEIWRPYGERA